MTRIVAVAAMWWMMLTVSEGNPLNVLTYHNDNTRQGANTNEVLLTPANVNSASFGRLFSQAVDGYVFAQPLYVSGVAIPGQGTHNVVFAVTEHNSVYAFDADSNSGPTGGLLWHVNLGVSAIMPNNDFGNRYGQDFFLGPEIGLTGTPVIDLSTGTIYVCAFTHEGSNYVHRLHALDITTGAEMPYSPVVVAASVPGGGVASTNGVVYFVPEQQLQRTALTLAGGMLFVAFGSQADSDPYHGWVLGYDASNLQLDTNYVFNTTPQATIADFGANAGEAGIWMAGNGLCVDANTNLYFMTGNGSFSANTNGGDYGDSFVRLSTINGLAVADYFTPYYQAALAADDVDLGSGGALLLPDSAGSAAHPHLIVGCGKEGNIYLVDRDNMGHYNPNNDNQIAQELDGAIGGAWSSAAYFNGQIYYQGQRDVLKAFSVNNATLSSTTVSQSSTPFGFPGATPEISANGTQNAIAWVIQSDAYASSGPAILHAYNATNLAQELYNTSQNLARDNPGGAVKMTVPVVVNGKVYVGAQYFLSVYGNGVFLPVPEISPNGGLFTNGLTITLTGAPGASLYYTLDGTAPSSASLLYTGPFVLNASANLQVIAIQSGAVSSGIASASFVNTAASGSGNGLQAEYFSDQLLTFTQPPTVVRTDAGIDFNWNGTAPAPSVSPTNFTVRWTGSVEPRYSETYTFYATTAGAVRLWINGEELINEWSDQPLTQWSSSIPLVAQQLYNIELDYGDQLAPAQAELFWSSPSTPLEVIPQAQLYPVTNPPPTVVLTAPSSGASATAAASLSLAANADAPFNPVVSVGFYANSTFLGAVSNVPYALTATGLSAGSYSLTAVATDGSGLSSTSAPVNVTINSGSGLPYGLTNRVAAQPFFNMPSTYLGSIPSLLSQTGVFSDTPGMVPVKGLIPYSPNVPLWSDNALKVRYLAVPSIGGPVTPDQQITFAPTGAWTFPAGTVFVKTFELLTNQSNPASILRLETRLLVRDVNGAVYGVTYKWRANHNDADLLLTNLTEPISIHTPRGVVTQNWYYPSPADCLTCHTPVANYVLGVNTRQLNATMAYPSGVKDNELRTLNRLGLFYPALDEAAIPNYEMLSSLTNPIASYQNRARSYLDANCAQCHQPGGTGPTFDARYDTPLANQNIINAPVLANLGYPGAAVIVPDNVTSSVLYDRINTLDPAIKMPPLARNLIDSNAVQVMAGWINSLPPNPPPPVYTLNVSASPANGGTAIGGGTFATGSTQEATALANTGFSFIGWTGDATGTNNPLDVTMSANLNLTANFAAIATNITLTVTTNGGGSVTPNLNGKNLKAGRSYVLTATAASGNVFSNWTGSLTTNRNPLTLKITSSMALQANFISNPFPPFVGTYNGLFAATNGIVTEQTAGMLRGLTINKRGTYSATLWINGASHGLSGTFGLDGQASYSIPRTSVGPLAVVMILQGNNLAPELTGTVTGASWGALLTAERATNTTGSGRYTMLIQPDASNTASISLPGDGYAVITNHAGIARITGALADGTSFSQAVPVSLTGDIPIYANLYGSKGLLLGWINLESTNDTEAALAWVHPALRSGLFTDAFSSTNEIALSPWTDPPPSEALPTHLGVFDATQTNEFAIMFNQKLKLEEVTGSMPLTGSINLQNGLFTVTTGSGTHKSTGYGVMLLNAVQGGGYMLTKTNAQAIQLTP